MSVISQSAFARSARAEQRLTPLLIALFLIFKEQIDLRRPISPRLIADSERNRTSCLSAGADCSSSELQNQGWLGCGANRDRTGNLLVANQALSQLSYSPGSGDSDNLKTVGLSRVELLTSRLSGVRSNHLSYRPRSM
jgi:hypothetical protein